LQPDFEALQKACLYSIPPNSLGYCGPKESQQAFKEFLAGPSPENSEKAQACLRRFYALFPYLELIARENGRQPFDSLVIEAYWLGNSLLENIRFKETQKTILGLQKHGLPKSIAEKKASELPEGMKPHHSMHVLYVNFINPKVRPAIQNLSSCLVQWAEVKEASEKTPLAKGMELFAESGQLKLREKTKKIQNPFGLELKPKGLVSVHWNQAIEKISKTQSKNLKKATEETLSLIQA
jgi:hypothetical protein